MTKKSRNELLDGLLHPVRMRVLMVLADSPGLTPQQIANLLRDIPQASLYRHISRLAQAGILQVVAERPVRGTVEKVYALNTAATHLDAEAVAGLSKEDHLRYFTAFTVALIDQFSRYLQSSEQPDMARDGAGYTQVALFMSDAELLDFSRALNQALLPFAIPAEGRKKRILSTIFLPEVSGK